MEPRSISFLPFSSVMFFHWVTYPTKVRRMMYLPAFTAGMRNLPFSSVDIPVTCALSLGLSSTTEVPGSGPPSAASVTVPVSAMRWAKASSGMSSRMAASMNLLSIDKRCSCFRKCDSPPWAWFNVAGDILALFMLISICPCHSAHDSLLFVALGQVEWGGLYLFFL